MGGCDVVHDVDVDVVQDHHVLRVLVVVVFAPADERERERERERECVFC